MPRTYQGGAGRGSHETQRLPLIRCFPRRNVENTA